MNILISNSMHKANGNIYDSCLHDLPISSYFKIYKWAAVKTMFRYKAVRSRFSPTRYMQHIEVRSVFS